MEFYNLLLDGASSIGLAFYNLFNGLAWADVIKAGIDTIALLWSIIIA